MASLRFFTILCLAAVATCATQPDRPKRQLLVSPQQSLPLPLQAAPLLRQGGYLQPQLLNGGAYLQPQLLNGRALLQPQLLNGGAYLQPQLLNGGAYLQPQLLNGGAYLQPQLLNGGGYLRSQLLQRGYYGPQLLPGNALLQPQLLRAPYGQPQLLPLSRRLVQAAQPSRVIVSSPALPAAPQALLRPAALSSGSAAILRQASDSTPDGAYSFGYDSEDGTSVQTSAGPAIPIGPEETIQSVSGSYSYTSPEGIPITTNWIADENGFRAEGEHLPRGPLNQ